MNLTSIDTPYFQSGYVKKKEERLPMTPHFFPHSSGFFQKIAKRFPGIHGPVGFSQHRQTKYRSAPVGLICGHKRFMSKVVVWDLTGEITKLSPYTCLPATGVVTTTSNWDIEFDEIAGEINFPVVVDEDTVGTPSVPGTFVNDLDSEIWTETTGVENRSKTWNTKCEDFAGTVTTTLSVELTPTVVDGWLTRWLAKSEDFRRATRTVTNRRIRGGKIASRAESTEADFYQVMAGEAKAQGPWFVDSWARQRSTWTQWTTNDSVSLADHWNGKYNIHILVRRRKNIPVLWNTWHRTGNRVAMIGLNSRYFGKVQFPNGQVEAEHEENTDGSWLTFNDDGGTFNYTTGSDPSGLLDGSPMYPTDALGGQFETDLGANHLPNVWLSQLVFISATGRHYRITIAAGSTDEGAYYDAMDSYFTAWAEWSNGGEVGPEPIEPDYADFSSWDHQAYVLTMDPSEAPRVTLRDDDPPYEEIRYQKIEERRRLGEAWVWVVVFDFSIHGDVGDRVADRPKQGCLLLTVNQRRIGSRYGFKAFDGSFQFYKRRLWKSHRDTPGAGATADEQCGTSYPAGSYNVETSQEYSDAGELQEESVDLLERFIGSVVCHPEVSSVILPSAVSFSNRMPSGRWVEDPKTATRWRKTNSGETADYGFLTPRLDEPDENGEILEESWISLPVTKDLLEQKNWTAFSEFGAPAAGSTVFIEGCRLSYDPS